MGMAHTVLGLVSYERVPATKISAIAEQILAAGWEPAYRAKNRWQESYRKSFADEDEARGAKQALIAILEPYWVHDLAREVPVEWELTPDGEAAIVHEAR